MKAHFFFDNSNIWGGANALRKINEPRGHWAGFRIYWRNLFRLMTKGHDVVEAILGGSVPPQCAELWKYARHEGFVTDLLQKVDREDGSVGEQGVDELLHLKIANCLLDYDPRDHVLVIATGDGRESDFGTGFKAQIERALKRGWKVELWSWKPTLNSCYTRMAKTYPNLSIRLLDPHYYSVTFMKGGTYHLKRAGSRVAHTVADRVVAPLR